MSAPNTCDTCKHWRQPVLLGSVCADGDVPSPQGMRKTLHTYTLGDCRKFIPQIELVYGATPSGQSDIVSPLNVLAFEATSGNQWNDGISAPQTGPKFGCIHHEPK